MSELYEESKLARIGAFEVMPCMCGGQRCGHCSYVTRSRCNQPLTHCPKCGQPREKAIGDQADA